MGTRSFIAVEAKPNRYYGVYCHWDGYLSHNGRILHRHYNSFQKAMFLIRGGSLSTLGESIGHKIDYDIHHHPVNQCVYHHRDMNRDYEEPELFASINSLCRGAESCGAEYLYVYFIISGWQYACRGPQFFGGSDGTKMSGFMSLRPAVEEELLRIEEESKARKAEALKIEEQNIKLLGQKHG